MSHDIDFISHKNSGGFEKRIDPVVEHHQGVLPQVHHQGVELQPGNSSAQKERHPFGNSTSCENKNLDSLQYLSCGQFHR
jgi:hypothetical protein